MKILYFTDDYAKNVMGTKISIATELQKHCEVIILHHNQLGKIHNLIQTHNPNLIWFVHTGLKLSPEDRKKVKVPIVGVGMSDPYMQDKISIESYDVYITNHNKTFNALKDKIPVIYNQTACDFRFHNNMGIPKTKDISIIGLGTHLRWGSENTVRIEYANKLRELGIDVYCYGTRWDKHPKNFGHIEGQDFLQVINSSKLGLDIQADFAPLAHRMFEYSSCGTPCMTRRREEAHLVFQEDTEILMYDTFDELRDKVKFYLDNQSLLASMGFNAEARCRMDHNVSNRVNHIISELKKLSIWK